MDVDNLLKISSKDVLKVLSYHKTIVQTLVPEKYRLYEGNKKGVLRSPTAVCLGPYGNFCLLMLVKAHFYPLAFITLLM